MNFLYRYRSIVVQGWALSDCVILVLVVALVGLVVFDIRVRSCLACEGRVFFLNALHSISNLSLKSIPQISTNSLTYGGHQNKFQPGDNQVSPFQATGHSKT